MHKAVGAGRSEGDMAFSDQYTQTRLGAASRAESSRTESARAEAVRVESDRTMSGERVLVVDDEPIVTEVVQRYLIREGYKVSVAADGRAALKEAREGAPDLVVLDLMLPEIDGLEVCRQLRAESSVPIIMLTAKG